MFAILGIAGAICVLLFLRQAYVWFMAEPICPTKLDNGYCQYCDDGKKTITIERER